MPPSYGQIYYYNRPLTAQNGPVQLQIGFLQRFANNKISENKKGVSEVNFLSNLLSTKLERFFYFFSRKGNVWSIQFKSLVFIQSFCHNIRPSKCREISIWRAGGIQNWCLGQVLVFINDDKLLLKQPDITSLFSLMRALWQWYFM